MAYPFHPLSAERNNETWDTLGELIFIKSVELNSFRIFIFGDSIWVQRKYSKKQNYFILNIFVELR